MKCQAWNEDDELCEIHASIPDYCDGCSRGWLQFWTPAERAGIKAMGRGLKCIENEINDLDANQELYKRKILNPIFPPRAQKIGAWRIIRAYVKAARAVKESK